MSDSHSTTLESSYKYIHVVYGCQYQKETRLMNRRMQCRARNLRLKSNNLLFFNINKCWHDEPGLQKSTEIHNTCCHGQITSN